MQNEGVQTIVDENASLQIAEENNNELHINEILKQDVTDQDTDNNSVRWKALEESISHKKLPN